MKKTVLFLSILVYKFSIFAQNNYTDSLINFVKENKKKLSLNINYNNESIVKINSKETYNLKDVYNLFILLEYCKQAGKDIIDETKLIHINEVKKYYIEYIDKNNFDSWLSYLKNSNKILSDSVSIYEIAKGIYNYGVAANAEFLIDVCGFDNIKNNIQLLNLTHSAIFPIPASLHMFQDPKRVGENKILKAIQSLKEPEYCKSIFYLHNELKLDSGKLAKNFRSYQLTDKMIKSWEERLPISNTETYLKITQILNSKKLFDKITLDTWDELFDLKNKKTISFSGKTGSIFSHIYSTTKDENSKIEFILFANELKPNQTYQLNNWKPFLETELKNVENILKLKNALFSLKDKEKK